MCLLCASNIGFSQNTKTDIFKQPLYVGLMGGYGSTTWQGLVPQIGNQNTALSISTPIDISEGGLVWGAVAGYEITKYFALEADYMMYPDATIFFDKNSIFAFEHNNEISLKTQTQTASLNARVMLVLPKTSMRLFSSAGIATVIRKDNVAQLSRVSPTFGFGVNILFTEHIMGEIGTNYTAGYGESELNPVEDFVPFLYSIFGKIAYRF